MLNRWLSPFPYEKRHFWYVIAVIWFLSSYTFTNQFPIYEPQYLPMTQVDKSIPFLPWTAWIYSTVYFMPIALPMFIKNRYYLNLAVIAFFVIATLEAVIFFTFPTTYPRHLYPLPDGIEGFPLNFLRKLDQPTNCFPSQHVSFAFLTAFVIDKINWKKGAIATLWALAIAISTLTTKQHYIWDLVFGYAITRIVFLTISRIVPAEAD